MQPLPLFPLNMVLFPGTAAPLHLFEPRYRQLLADVRDRDRRFGLVCNIPGASERDLPLGRVGCVCEITNIEMLPDGRSNVLVVGRDRFTFDGFVDYPAPYRVAQVTTLRDTNEGTPVGLTLAADEVASDFRRVVSAVQSLNNDESKPPALPDDPAQLPWTIAAMIDFDLPARQRLLEERSPVARLATIHAALRKVLPDLELQAAIHRY